MADMKFQDFLGYRGRHPEYKPTPEQESVISAIANSRVADAAGSPYREPEGWGDWAARNAKEIPGRTWEAAKDMWRTDLTPEEQLKDFGRSLPGSAANMVEGTAGTPGDMGGLKWEIVKWLNDQFKGSSNMDLGLDLARAEKFDRSNLPTSEWFRNNVTRPVVGSSVDYEPKAGPGKTQRLLSNVVGVEDAVPGVVAKDVIKLLRAVR